MLSTLNKIINIQINNMAYNILSIRVKTIPTADGKIKPYVSAMVK